MSADDLGGRPAGYPPAEPEQFPTACADAPELFTSTDFQDHLMARDSCATCYLYRDLCRDVANTDKAANGTYGGDFYVNGRAVVIDRRRV